MYVHAHDEKEEGVQNELYNKLSLIILVEAIPHRAYTYKEHIIISWSGVGAHKGRVYRGIWYVSFFYTTVCPFPFRLKGTNFSLSQATPN